MAHVVIRDHHDGNGAVPGYEGETSREELISILLLLHQFCQPGATVNILQGK